MAKSGGTRQDYRVPLRALREKGPQRLYLLWGPEDYLREYFFGELKNLCLPQGDDGFSLKRINGPELDVNQLRDAVDSVPFMSERSLVELRGVDINKLSEPEEYISVLSDIPDFCTVVFIQGCEYEPDGRLKLIKMLKAKGTEVKFTLQSGYELNDWVRRRFADAGKTIDNETVDRLIFVSGQRMNTLVPEIEKIAAFSRDSRVTVEDVEAVAEHIPEAIIFDITALIAQKEYDKASAKLAELLAGRKNEPIANLAMIGYQMRQLYAARVAVDEGLGARFLMESCGVKSDYVASKLIDAAHGFTLKQLSRAVELCAETDYQMKSSSVDDEMLLRELFMRIACGAADV